MDYAIAAMIAASQQSMAARPDAPKPVCGWCTTASSYANCSCKDDCGSVECWHGVKWEQRRYGDQPGRVHEWIGVPKFT